MSRRLDLNLWKRYLEAEDLGREAEAEAALVGLFRALPELAPRSGFAARVLVRIAQPTLFSRRPVRWALAAALVAVAVGTALLAPMLPSLARLVGASGLVSALVETTSWLALSFASGASLWNGVESLLGALGRAALLPQMLWFLIIQLAAAALALRGLTRLAFGKRSPHHALPH